MKNVKFATQLDNDTLKILKNYAKESGRSLSGIVNQAVVEYLAKNQIRPAFRQAMEEVLNENEELLKRLAK